MELPTVGQHCSKSDCNKLDFLPIKCDMCFEIFCADHYSYLRHDCKNAYRKDNQVPVCPLCNKPVPIPAGRQPDQIVGAHIDTDCQSAPTRKVFTNKCTVKNCKGKEIIPVLCSECRQNFCLRHRHPQDHQCHKQNRTNTRNIRSTSQMKEDEDFARAIAMSLQEEARNQRKHVSQEDRDSALARQLQEAEYQGSSTNHSRDTRERCAVV